MDEYLQQEMMQRAVERQLEVLGEAARRISVTFKHAHPEIPWQSIIGQRNVLAHEYEEINPVRIWRVVTTHIPALLEHLTPLLPPLPPEHP